LNGADAPRLTTGTAGVFSLSSWSLSLLQREMEPDALAPDARRPATAAPTTDDDPCGRFFSSGMVAESRKHFRAEGAPQQAKLYTV
jgi:hypothetical protein